MSDAWQSGPDARNQQQPPSQPQAHYPPAQCEGIAVTARFFPTMIIMFAFNPHVVIDGYAGPAAKWGRNVIPIRPGRHRVEVYADYFTSKIGKAVVDVDVYPGHFVELEYKVPIWYYTPGSLGPPPQKYNNFGAIIGTAAVLAFFFVLVPLLLILRMTGILP